MPEFNAMEMEIAPTQEKPARKPWSPPRVIESDVESTEAGSANIPEVSGGVLSS
jgi:hypothetical protein